MVAGYGKKRQWEFSKLPFQIPLLLPTIVINPGIAENDEDILFGCIHALTESFDPAKIPVSTSPFPPDLFYTIIKNMVLPTKIY